MSYDIFSKRGKKPPDVYSYDDVPETLRVQVLHSVDRAIRSFTLPPGVYEDAADILREEYGVFRLVQYPRKNLDEVREFFLNESDVERVLDVVEVLLRLLLDKSSNDPSDYFVDLDQIISNAIVEVNQRFKEHGVGYEFLNGRIIRKDSEYIHTEVVKPALLILHRKEFQGASEEFLEAHKYYRQKDNKAAINECLKSFESVMKSICDKRNWTYPKNPTANILIEVCFKNNLISSHWQSQFSALSALLKSGVPTGRNRLSGHGQGQTPQPVPDHIVKFLMHQTASLIVFLGDAESNR